MVQNENDQFKYLTNSGVTLKIITLHLGSYEILTLNKEIKRQVSISHTNESKLNHEAETAVIRNSLSLDNTHKMDFNIARSLKTLLGLEKEI